MCDIPFLKNIKTIHSFFPGKISALSLKIFAVNLCSLMVRDELFFCDFGVINFYLVCCYLRE